MKTMDSFNVILAGSGYERLLLFLPDCQTGSQVRLIGAKSRLI